MKTEDILKDAREAFDLACEHESENRREALDDIRFARLGEQWPDKVRRDRELDGRPCLTINRLPAFIRQVVNDARQNKPAISCHPVDDGADPETAEIFNGLIRNIEQSSDAEVAYDTALDFAVTGGFGYFRINTRYAGEDSFDQDLVIERVANPFSIYGDPNSQAADSSDWNTAFVVDTLPKAAFEARWKGADAVDWSADSYAGLGGPWLEGDRVMVAEYWRREAVMKTLLALSDGQVVERGVYEAQKAMFDALGVSVIGRHERRRRDQSGRGRRPARPGRSRRGPGARRPRRGRHRGGGARRAGLPHPAGAEGRLPDARGLYPQDPGAACSGALRLR